MIPLVRLPPGMPFIVDGKVYYRRFVTSYNLVECYLVKNGIIDFKKPQYFDKSQNVEPYEFRKKSV